MKGTPRQKLYLGIATALFVSHLVIAAVVKPSFALTMCGDAFPTALVVLAILAIRENLRTTPGVSGAFWKLFAGGLTVVLVSQLFWFYFDWRRLNYDPSPVIGDSLFIIAHVFFLSALALRPHSASARSDLGIRSLDFALLSLWWLCLYGYFAWPWQIVLRDLSQYNPAYYILTLIEHLVILAIVAVLAARRTGAWRIFYLQLTLAFALIAAGNLLLSVAIDEGKYYAGGYYDTLFFAGLYVFTWVACFGASLQPQKDAAPNRELVVSVWTARVAMAVILSLPLVALLGLGAKTLPQNVATFRLRLIFGFMSVLGGLAYWKLNLLTRELVRLVHLTRGSIENLKSVQQRVSDSEKFVALGRLAAGAAHEISNPLTAILGYSELLADIPALSPEDRLQAKEIRGQVHRAQAAVASLRHSMSLSLSLKATPVMLINEKEKLS
jgi:signal transduction histidine kinase